MSTTREGDRTDAEQADDNVTFPTVVRGYERHQVDRYVARQRRIVQELNSTLAEVQERLRLADERARSDSGEQQRLRNELAGRNLKGPESFGSRAEKLLRLAESEASEMRAGAARESASLVEQARVAAEQHRHESEQAVIARARELDQETRRRTAELVDREEKVAELVASGRAESERVRVAAAEAAAKLRDEAQAEAELIKARARAEAGRTREDARVELNRVTALRGEVHTELDRLHRLLADQLGLEAVQPASADEQDAG